MTGNNRYIFKHTNNHKIKNPVRAVHCKNKCLLQCVQYTVQKKCILQRRNLKEYR